MRAITEDSMTVNDIEFRTFGTNPKHGNADLEVKAGTTGFRGKVPREKSARCFLAIDCNNGDYFFRPFRNEKGRITGFGICCCGDDALYSLLEAVDFIQEALQDEIC